MTDCDGVKKGSIFPDPCGFTGMFSFIFTSSGPRQEEEIIDGD